MRRRSWLVVAVLAVPLVTGPPAHADTSTVAVTAFQGSWDSPSLIDTNAPAITTVGVDGVDLNASGTAVAAPAAAARRQLTRAHADQLPAELLVGNYSNAIDDFSEPVAFKMLSSAANRHAVVLSLAADVRSRGWDGISVDLESLLGRDRPGLTAFVTELRAALPSAATLSICLQAHTRTADYAGNGYDLTAIAAHVDRVILMTYDQHGPWENQPGPVGALPWMRACANALLADVPAAQVDLGVAGYGYAWRPHSNDTLSDAQARQLAGSNATWNASAGEWTATLADGSTLWWSDHRSYLARSALGSSSTCTELPYGIWVCPIRSCDPTARLLREVCWGPYRVDPGRPARPGNAPFPT